MSTHNNYALRNGSFTRFVWAQPTKDQGYWKQDGHVTGISSSSQASYKNGSAIQTSHGLKYVTPYPYSRFVIEYGSCTSYERENPAMTNTPRPLSKNYWVSAYQPRYDVLRSNEDLLQSALSKFDSDGASTNAEMLAKDLTDASRLVTEYAERMLSACKYIKKGRWAKAYRAFNARRGSLRNSRQAIADHWLAFQWGIKPSMDAIVNAYNLATDSDEKRTFRVRTSASTKETCYRTVENWPKEARTVTVGGRTRRMMVSRHFHDMSARDFAALWNNPIVPFWDAVPWSFLVDWFIPIGDYLTQFGYYTNALTPPIIDGCNSYKLETTLKGRIEDVSRYTIITTEFSGFYDMQFRRTVDSSVHAKYAFSDIIDKSAFGITKSRAINMMALLASKLGK